MKQVNLLKEVMKRMDDAIMDWDYDKYDHYARIVEKHGVDPIRWYEQEMELSMEGL